MTLWKQIIVLATLCLAMRASRTYANYDSPESYLEYCNFTQDQTKYILEKSDEVRNKDHYIKWIWAISAHEMWSTFKDWETKFFAGRLHPAMKYKDFKTQVDWWTTAYNKYRYKNNTSHDWIKRSRYCVTENDWTPNCPNWVRNVPHIASLYKSKEIVEDNPKLVKTVASKSPTPIAGNKRCKIIYTTPANGYIQTDDYMGRFINRIRWLKKGSKVFFCWDV